MTLSRSMSIKLAALMAGIVLLAGVAVWQLQRLTVDVQQALDSHDRWQEVYSQAVSDVGTSMIIARNVLSIQSPRIDVAINRLTDAAMRLDSLVLPADASAEVLAGRADTLAVLRRIVSQLKTMPDQHTPEQLAGLGRELDGAYGLMAKLASELRRTLATVKQTTQRRSGQTAWAISILAGLVVIGAAVVGVWQHRSVMGPVRRVASGVRQIATGRFDLRLPTRGHDELVELATDFNHMTGQLDELYQSLEQKVAQKSRELVLSERLASVGYLAAGVAHEINNPLAIIAGHAELLLRKAQALDPQVRQSLQVICDEAFRCKQITGRLLSLARGQDEARQKVSLRMVASDVVKMVADLPKYRARQLEVVIGADEPLHVIASSAQMKQVLLNLVVNALEAVESGSGRVTISGRRDSQSVELSVTDNGRGMEKATLERVFEPFFTMHRGTGEPGTGLGLSICHAIVSEHGGSISASSEGLNKGSSFTMRLPTTMVE